MASDTVHIGGLSFVDIPTEKQDGTKETLGAQIKRNCYCTQRRLWKILTYFLPIVKYVKYYKLRENILTDALVGVTIGILHIPQALAFGLLASIKLENGLYTSLWPILLYVIFGTSPHVSMGTSAVICMVTASVVDKQADIFKENNRHLFNTTTSGNGSTMGHQDIIWEDIPEFMDFKENVAMNIALFSGVILIAMGLLKLGFITAYLSESFFAGFTSGAAVHIATSQIPALLGLNVQRFGGAFKIIYTYNEIFNHITEVNVATILIGIFSGVIVVVIKDVINERFKEKLFIPIPGELIVVIVATLISYLGSFEENFAVNVVGDIPNDIPAPVAPKLIASETFYPECFVIAILIFANTIAIAKICAKKHNYEIDDNQEVFAYGMCNFVSAFFKCLPSAVAPPRSMVASSMGVKTTISGIFAVLLMLLVILVISVLFGPLPKAALAAIIVVALKGLFIQMLQCKTFWRINKFDFLIWFATIVSVVFLDIDYGLYIGVCVSMITVIWQSQHSRATPVYVTDEAFGLSKYGNLELRKKFMDGGIKIFRFQSSLYFANAEIFRQKLYKRTVNPRKIMKLLQKKEKLVKKTLPSKQVSMQPAAKVDGVVNNGFDAENKTEMVPQIAITESHSSPDMNDHESDYVDPAPKITNDENSISTISTNTAPDYLNVPPNLKNRKISQAPSVISVATDDSGYDEDEEFPNPLVRLKEFQKTRFIIIDCAPINYLDASGASVLGHIYTEYANVGIKMLLAGVAKDVITSMEHAQVFDKIPRQNLHVTIMEAVHAAEGLMAVEPSKKPVSRACSFSFEEACEESCAANT